MVSGCTSPTRSTGQSIRNSTRRVLPVGWSRQMLIQMVASNLIQISFYHSRQATGHTRSGSRGATPLQTPIATREYRGLERGFDGVVALVGPFGIGCVPWPQPCNGLVVLC